MTQTQMYTPPESFPLDPPPPYSIFDPITLSESDDSDVFPQTTLIMILIQIGICNPSPHTPLYLYFIISLLITIHTTCSNLKKKIVKLQSTTTMSRESHGMI